MTYTEALKTNTLIKFLRRLCKDIDKKLFIIMANLAVQHSNKLMRWVDARKHKIDVFYLPPDSPELNLDERLNRDLKNHFHSGITATDKTKLKRKLVSYLKSIQKTPKRVKNYFSSSLVRYATQLFCVRINNIN